MKTLGIGLTILAAGLAWTGSLAADEPPGRTRRGATTAPRGEYTRQQVQTMHQRADQLASELEHLLEDIAIEGRRTRRLYNQADAVHKRFSRLYNKPSSARTRLGRG